MNEIKRYAVLMTNQASKDMEAIYDYIANDLRSPENALGQYKRISEAILSLETMPGRCEMFSEEPEHSWGMRRLIVGNYLVCYVVDEDSVTVTDVLYGASDIHLRLQKRRD